MALAAAVAAGTSLALALLLVDPDGLRDHVLLRLTMVRETAHLLGWRTPVLAHLRGWPAVAMVVVPPRTTLATKHLRGVMEAEPRMAVTAHLRMSPVISSTPSSLLTSPQLESVIQNSLHRGLRTFSLGCWLQDAWSFLWS